VSSPRSTRRIVLQRLLAAAIIVLLVPLVVLASTVLDDQAMRVGEPAPTTVIADREVREVDEAATENARRVAAESVEPVRAVDRDAQTEIVGAVRRVFDDTRSVRQPVATDDGEEAALTTPSRNDQVEELTASQEQLAAPTIEALITLSNADLETVERETIAVAQELARQRVSEDELDDLLADSLQTELALRSFPRDTAAEIARPVIEAKMRPTVVVDPELTALERQRAAEAVEEVAETWRAGEAIVRENEVVGPLQLQAIERLGQSGSPPWRLFVRAALAMLLVVTVGGIYLGRMQPRVWVSGKKLLLTALLVTAYAGLVAGTTVLTEATSVGWSYVVPAAALGMLTALLIHQVVGIAMMLPASIIVLLVMPEAAPVALFAAAAVLISVPMTTRISSRSDLRSATLRAGLSFPVLAAIIVAVFGPREDLFAAVAAGAINGVVTAVAVQGAMPFLETLFRLPTVTALLDLADRNHPLLRELEEKALGTYNHSVMVASLTERTCRAVGADPLVGSVAALYHDIGKVRQPHYFIENQQGIANPHDDLEPEVSALIIQSHVTDGVEMAREYKLPPEIVACIGSHHGTMVVSYFYEQAIAKAGGDASAVDEETYRYKGERPRSKEAAILMFADCCEATTRSMALSRGNLPREDIEQTVDRLLEERIADHQFDRSELTFHDLKVARDQIIESLVGVYHPRIPYPKRTSPVRDDTDPPAGTPGDEPTSVTLPRDAATAPPRP
jgi:cyclic-di-AMP phosphodiesterase PgpH